MATRGIKGAFFAFQAAIGTALVLGYSPALGAGPKGTLHQFVVPKQGQMIGDARYHCWIPEGVPILRSVIVHQHGCTTEGSAPPMVNDVQWLSLAKKWNSAFIAPMLVTGPNGTSDCPNWWDVDKGSGNTFLAALDTLARASKHPEIKTIPWALWGHSGGSIWSTGMVGKYPERVAVAVAQSCGTEISSVSAALKVPILHHNGKLDICYNDTQFSNARKKGAYWAHAVNPNAPSTGDGHMVHDMRLLAIRWFDFCLPMRLPPKAGESQLREMDTTGAWLGNKADVTIAASSGYAGDKLAACWFPNREMAEKWIEYTKSGTLKDSTPGPAAYNLAGTLSGARFTLKWDSDADLEGGIKTFKIYRNGVSYRTLKYATTSTYSSTPGFQRWNECDQPNPSPAPAMTWTDSAANDTGTFTYQVALVNWSDTEGAKSAPLTLSRGQATGIVKVLGAPQQGLSRDRSFSRYFEVGRPDLGPGVFGVYELNGRQTDLAEKRPPSAHSGQ